MDRSLRQVMTLGKVTVIALTASPIILLLSALFARHDQFPVSVEVHPEAPAATAEAATPKLKVAPASRQISASEMLRPELTTSLVNRERDGTASHPNTDPVFIASSGSGNPSQAAMTIPGLEPATLVAATPSVDVGPTKLLATRLASTDATAPAREERSSAETASAADSYDDLAWPDQWLAPRGPANDKQIKATKMDKGKKHSPHVRVAQKERKPWVPTPRKDSTGPDDDQSDNANASPVFQPNIEDGPN